MPILSIIGVGAAEVAAARGDHRDCAVLLGAAARLRGAEDPTEPRIARLTHNGRASLGEEAFGEAYTAGWSLDPQTARARVDPTSRPGLALTVGRTGDPESTGTPDGARLHGQAAERP